MPDAVIVAFKVSPQAAIGIAWLRAMIPVGVRFLTGALRAGAKIPASPEAIGMLIGGLEGLATWAAAPNAACFPTINDVAWHGGVKFLEAQE
jgi:hypothetical protein